MWSYENHAELSEVYDEMNGNKLRLVVLRIT
jgi:hypothetical protein